MNKPLSIKITILLAYVAVSTMLLVDGIAPTALLLSARPFG